MELSIHVNAIQSDLASAAALGDETTAEAGRRLAEALESSLQLRIMDVLTEAALGLSSALRDGHVEVRLSGRNPELVFVEDAPGEGTVQAGPGDDLSARITLRLPEHLKVQVEVAADREGISTNAWIVRALARALEPRGRSGRVGTRLQGFARS